MSSRRFNRFGAVLAVGILLGGSAAVQPARGQAAAPSAVAAGDIELAKPPKYPTMISPTNEGGQILDTHHGEPMLVQEFMFNPTTHELSLSKNPPTKQRMYGDSRIDASTWNADLNIFDYLTTDRAPIGKIVLTCAKKKFQISSNYVVSLAKDKQPAIDPSTYQASVQFAKGEESSKPGTTLTMHRNAEPPVPLADTTFTKISRKNDVITWTIERGGAVIKSGSFGFPVVATDPDLVKYVIQLP